MAKKKNNIVIFVLIGVFILASAAAYFASQGRNKGEEVTIEKTEKRTIKETVEASGKIFPKTEVKISSDVSGEIVELYVNEGDSVRSGQVLARVDPEAYNSQVERAQAGVNSSQASVANAKAQIETLRAQKEQIQSQLTNAREIHARNTKLHAEGVVSDQDFEVSQANVRTLEANLRAADANIRSAQESTRGAEFQVKSAQASLKEINTSLKRTTIYATMDGIVSKLNVEKGERVVGTSMMAGTEILRIADLNVMEVQVEVTENDLPRLTLGQTVDIEIDAYLDRKFTGRVVEIAQTANNLGSSVGGNVALTTDQVTNFVVTIDIDPASYRDLITAAKPYPFRPGMSASVEILTNTKTDVVSVPIQAVGTRDREQDEQDGTAKPVNSSTGFDDLMEIVFVVSGDTLNMVEVTTGIQDDDYIEILSGLKGGEEIVTGPYAAVSRKLEQGSAFKIKEEDDDKKKEE